MIGVRPLSTATKQNVQANEDSDHRGNCFFKMELIIGDTCYLVIDTRNCTYAIFEEAMKELGLKLESHPEPYHVT